MILRNGPRYLDRLRSTLVLLRQKSQLIHFTMGGWNESPLHYAARGAHDEACQIIIQLGWWLAEINKPAGPAWRTPLQESVRWNRPSLFRLMHHDADVNVRALSPFDSSKEPSWTALHFFADQAHNGDDLGTVDGLITAGVPIDGRDHDDIITKTPFHIAVRKNAFRLTDKIISLSNGAILNSVSTRGAMLTYPHPITALGHIIALNARHSGIRAVRYLLSTGASFVVEAKGNVTALHLVALVPAGIRYEGDENKLGQGGFDWDTNSAIAEELLRHFCEQNMLDQRGSSKWGRVTALHIAAENGNVAVVEALVRVGASRELRYDDGETAREKARKKWSSVVPDSGVGGEDKNAGMLEKMLAWLE